MRNLMFPLLCSLLAAGMITFSGCYYTRYYYPKIVTVNKETGGSPVNYLIQLASEKRKVVLHNDSAAWCINRIGINEDGTAVIVLVGEKTDIAFEINTGNRDKSGKMSQSEKVKYNLLHVYVKNLIPEAGVELKIENDNILQFKYYIFDEEFHNEFWLLPW